MAPYVLPREEYRDAPEAREIAVLGLVLALALLVRLPGLNGPLWYDEILTLETHLRLPWAQMLETYSMNHHYLYSLQAKAAMLAFGEAPWVLRLPALVFGLAGIAAVWRLARELTGPGRAHLVALMLALSYHHIWFSQNARGYTELAFWSTLGMIFFLRGLAAPRFGTWLGFGLCLALGTFTHLSGGFFFAALGVVWLGRLVTGPRPAGIVVWPLAGAVIGVALTALLYAPVIPGVITAAQTVGGTSAVDVMTEYQSPFWTVAEAVRSGIGQAGAPMALAALAVIGLAVLGGIALRRPAFGLAVLLHILLTMALLSAIGMRIWPRFFFLDIGLLMILLVAGGAALCRWAGRITVPGLGRVLFAIGAVAAVALSCLLAARNYAAPKQNLAGAYAFATDTARPDERVYSVGYAGEAFASHFHAPWGRIMTTADYQAAIAQPGPLTLVVAFPQRVRRALPDLAADLDAGRLTLATRLPGTLGDGAVLVLRR